jgi:hypothetical protein
MKNDMGIMGPAVASAWQDRDHTSGYLLTTYLSKADLVIVDSATQLKITPSLEAADCRIQTALQLCSAVGEEVEGEGVGAQLARQMRHGLLRDIICLIRKLQAEVTTASTGDTAGAKMRCASKALIGIAIAHIALLAIPPEAKSDDAGKEIGWYVICHACCLGIFMLLAIAFWRQLVVKDRIAYTLRQVNTVIILWYSSLKRQLCHIKIR